MNKLSIEIVIQNDYNKIIKVSGDVGAEIKEHMIQTDGILLMKSGTLLFHINDADHTLHEDDHILIPADAFHRVRFETKGIFHLIVSTDMKFTFKK